MIISILFSNDFFSKSYYWFDFIKLSLLYSFLLTLSDNFSEVVSFKSLIESDRHSISFYSYPTSLFIRYNSFYFSRYWIIVCSSSFARFSCITFYNYYWFIILWFSKLFRRFYFLLNISSSDYSIWLSLFWWEYWLIGYQIFD